MSLLETYRRRLRAFWVSLPNRAYGTHVPSSRDDITRLVACCQTVSPEESARLAQKQWSARKLIQDQPDSVQPLRDVPEDLPIG